MTSPLSVGIHADDTHISTDALAAIVRAAQQAGFAGVQFSDGFRSSVPDAAAWPWFSAASAGCTGPVCISCVPAGRYHPRALAAAARRAVDQHPGRFRLALEGWPTTTATFAAALQAPAESPDDDSPPPGQPTADTSQLPTPGGGPPAVLAMALTPRIAAAAATWADGLLTLAQPVARLQRILSAYRDSGGRGPLACQVPLSWADDEVSAFRAAYEVWGSPLAEPPGAGHAWSGCLAEFTSRRGVAQSVAVSADVERHVEHLSAIADLGFDELYLHQVGADQRRFIEVFGSAVLPRVGS